MHSRTVFAVVLIGMLLLSFTPQNAARTAKSTKASPSLKSISSLSTYDNITTHEGDLIIDGTQTYVIENCTYVQRGNILVSGYAKMKIYNSVFRMDQDYWFQFWFIVDEQASLEVVNSSIDDPKGFGFDCSGYAKINMNNSDLGNTSTGAFGRATVIVSNCTANDWLSPSGNCRMIVLNSSLAGIELNWLPWPLQSEGVIDGLRVGYIEYLELQQDQPAIDFGYDLTLVNTTVNLWKLNIVPETEIVLSNSTLAQLWIWCRQPDAEIYGLHPGYFEDLEVFNLTLRKTSIADIWVAVLDSASVDLIDTKVGLHFFQGKCTASLSNSEVYSFMALFSYGILVFNRSSLACHGIAGTQLYILGDVTHIEWQGDWFSSNVTRNFNLLAEDTGGNPMEGVELTLFDRDNTLVWSGQAQSSGKADFNVTFSDGNYTDTLRLEAVKGNLSATKSISFLSDTPVTMVLGRHDIAMMNVAPAKTVVGQGHNLDTNFTVTNLGDLAETFYSTIYANTTNIGTYTVFNLANGTSTTLAFACSTAGLAYGNYTISANTQPVSGENFTANNNYTYSVPVHVGVPGDISGPTSSVYDGTVNMRDISYMIILFNTRPGSPSWNPNADVNGDGVLNMRDISIAILNFNRHE